MIPMARAEAKHCHISYLFLELSLPCSFYESPLFPFSIFIANPLLLTLKCAQHPHHVRLFSWDKSHGMITPPPFLVSSAKITSVQPTRCPLSIPRHENGKILSASPVRLCLYGTYPGMFLSWQQFSRTFT